MTEPSERLGGRLHSRFEPGEEVRRARLRCSDMLSMGRGCLQAGMIR
jgi:hypothetical protein